MTAELAPIEQPDLSAIERVVIAGDLSKLTPEQRWGYYRDVCQSVGLNPLTKPFDYITLNGKLTLYALKGATDQLRGRYGISISKPAVDIAEGLCIVTVSASGRDGRTDSDLGIVPIENLRGDARANAIMKAITKAKRRVTLSYCGLGMLDETEVETIPGARYEDAPVDPGPIPSTSRPEPWPDEQMAADRMVKGEDAPPAPTRGDLISAIQRGTVEARKRGIVMADVETDDLDYDQLTAALEQLRENVRAAGKSRRG